MNSKFIIIMGNTVLTLVMLGSVIYLAWKSDFVTRLYAQRVKRILTKLELGISTNAKKSHFYLRNARGQYVQADYKGNGVYVVWLHSDKQAATVDFGALKLCQARTILRLVAKLKRIEIRKAIVSNKLANYIHVD